MRCIPLYISLAILAQLAFAAPASSVEVANPRLDNLYMMDTRVAEGEPESGE